MASSPILTRPPDVVFATQGIAPPSGAYVGPNEHLGIVARSSLAVTLRFTARLLLANGVVQDIQQDLIVDATRNANNFVIALAEGFLLSARLISLTLLTTHGTTYCRVFLQPGLTNPSPTAVQVLAQGYVEVLASLNFPGGTHESAFAGHGRVRNILGTAPAAGAEILETVPANALWLLLSFQYSLTTGVAVPVRTTRLVLDDGANNLVVIEAANTQAASLINGHNWYQGAQRFAVGVTDGVGALPSSYVLLAGFRIKTVTNNLAAADAYSAPRYVVEEFIAA